MAKMDGPVFTRLQSQLDDKPLVGEALAVCDRTVDKLLAEQTRSSKPGMLLGKIQSGKTRTFMGVLALAFDNGFDHAVIFTKGTKALARQTIARLRKDLKSAIDADLIGVHDIMALPDTLTPWDLNLKLVFVCKKEDDNLLRLSEVLTDEYPELADKRVLIIDDEADLASIGFKRSKGVIEANVIPGQINDLRDSLTNASYLLVTATPYALYLQPEEIQIPADQKIFRPMFPAFTELVPVPDAYVGGEFYFEKCLDPASVASFLHIEVQPKELTVLRKADHPDLDLSEVLTTAEIADLRRAIITFVVGGEIRRWQQEQAGKHPIGKYSFIFHTEVSKTAHQWQHLILSTLISRLRHSAANNIGTISPLIEAAHADLAQSVALAGTAMPPLATVLQRFPAAVNATTIEKVNTDNDVEQLLDEKGQLMLRNPLNIFIGGNILDRGITIDNVIGFYYGRNPRRSQQDTVLQHARMYGYRAQDDLAVTRFYTTAVIYSRMDTIHQFDSALRSAFEKGGQENGVVFIRRDTTNQVVACSPNKILLSRLTTLRPGRQVLPYGFSTKTNAAGIVTQIDDLLAGVDPNPTALTYTLSLETAERVIDLIGQSLLMDADYEFDFNAMKAGMAYIAANNPNAAEANQVTCLVRRNRNDSKRRPNGRIQDAPYGAPDHKAIQNVRGARPALFLYREAGQQAEGWSGCPFYWPVLFPPPGMLPVVFSSKTGD